MPPKEWTPLAVLAQIYVYYRRENDWPTLRELAVFTDLPVEQVQRLVDILVDRRYVRVEGETIYPWEAGPSPVVTYQMSPEEIAARYGPPTRRRTKADSHHAEEAAEMPKGIYIDWPSNEELVAMADEIAARGGNVVDELCAQIGCASLTLKKRLRLARAAVRDLGSQTAPESAPDAVPDAEPPADSGASQGGEAEATTPEPDPGELMQMAEEEAARLVEASKNPQEADSENGHTSAYPKTRASFSEPKDRILVLLSYCSPDSPPPVIVEQDTMDRAPERPGDEWAELVRVNGRRTYRLWRCVAVLPDGAAVLIPVDAAIVQAESVTAARTA